MLRLIAVIILPCLLLASCFQQPARSGDTKFYTPVEYNDFIVDQQNAIIKRMIRLTATYDSGTAQEIRLQFDSLVIQSDQSLKHIQNLSDYEGDSTLRNQARKLFEFYNSIFHNEYKEMIGIFLKGPEATDEDIAELNRIVQSVRVKEEKLNADLNKTQTGFAKKFGFEFLDTTVTHSAAPSN